MHIPYEVPLKTMQLLYKNIYSTTHTLKVIRSVQVEWTTLYTIRILYILEAKENLIQRSNRLNKKIKFLNFLVYYYNDNDTKHGCI